MPGPARNARTTSRASALVIGAVMTIAVAGACSGSSDDVQAGSPSTQTEAAPVSLSGKVNDHGEKDLSGSNPELQMELDDSYFAPTYVKAEPGAVVKVELENEGSKTHTFTIDDHTVDVTVDPGSKATVDVTVPESGSLHYFCQFHSGSGMQGSFVVASAASTPTTGAAPSSTTPTSDDYGGY
jgi:plastocyanin